jgi:ComF family protein
LDQTRAFGAYDGALRLAHHSFKFEGMEGLKADLAGKMLEASPVSFWSGVEAIIPVPLSPERERERGYNPAFLLAKELSKQTGIPVRVSLRKIRPTKPQMSLSREERLKNPKGVYSMAEKADPAAKVVLVDDVFTTGATLEECAKTLKKAGVEWVGAIVFGRTP